MEKRHLHLKGPVLSRIVAGAWRWDSSPGVNVERLIVTALEAGISSFDHADIYGDYENQKNIWSGHKKEPIAEKANATDQQMRHHADFFPASRYLGEAL
ncbi:MAG: hypothetical protein WD824_11150 [Cyclobacteriaceae bacterium]